MLITIFLYLLLDGYPAHRSFLGAANSRNELLHHGRVAYDLKPSHELLGGADVVDAAPKLLDRQGERVLRECVRRQERRIDPPDMHVICCYFLQIQKAATNESMQSFVCGMSYIE